MAGRLRPRALRAVPRSVERRAVLRRLHAIVAVDGASLPRLRDAAAAWRARALRGLLEERAALRARVGRVPIALARAALDPSAEVFRRPCGCARTRDARRTAARTPLEAPAGADHRGAAPPSTSAQPRLQPGDRAGARNEGAARDPDVVDDRVTRAGDFGSDRTVGRRAPQE